MSPITTLKTLSEELAQTLTIENFRLIDGKLRNYSPKEVRYVAATLVSRFVGALVYRTLTEEQAINQTKEQHEAFIMKNAADLKNQIQNAVAAAFQNAMSAFSGQPVEYYCQIKVVPEPKSTTLN
jgi:hypothetical protein